MQKYIFLCFLSLLIVTSVYGYFDGKNKSFNVLNKNTTGFDDKQTPNLDDDLINDATFENWVNRFIEVDFLLEGI